jgi:hypothetical protein
VGRYAGICQVWVGMPLYVQVSALCAPMGRCVWVCPYRSPMGGYVPIRSLLLLCFRKLPVGGRTAQHRYMVKKVRVMPWGNAWGGNGR